MRNWKTITIAALICLGQVALAQTMIPVETFNKVVISPHIETTFVQGDEESVTILNSTAPDENINIEVKGKTLRVYLDDAKLTTKHKTVIENGVKRKIPLYKGKVLTIRVAYKTIDNLSLRGEQGTICESPIIVDQFKLKIYGESQVVFNEMSIKEFDVDIYGESQLIIKKGVINHQHITAFGEGEINLVAVENKTSKLKAYGEAEFRVQSSERIKFTAYGEAELHYKGNPEINKGLSIGASTINQIN